MAITCVKRGDGTLTMEGLSSDAKPTINVPGGSTFVETNTGRAFAFSGTAWTGSAPTRISQGGILAAGGYTNGNYVESPNPTAAPTMAAPQGFGILFFPTSNTVGLNVMLGHGHNAGVFDRGFQLEVHRVRANGFGAYVATTAGGQAADFGLGAVYPLDGNTHILWVNAIDVRTWRWSLDGSAPASVTLVASPNTYVPPNAGDNYRIGGDCHANVTPYAGGRIIDVVHTDVIMSDADMATLAAGLWDIPILTSIAGHVTHRRHARDWLGCTALPYGAAGMLLNIQGVVCLRDHG